MRNLHMNRLIAAIAIATVSSTSSIAAAQTVGLQPSARSAPALIDDQQPAAATADVVQPQAIPQAAQNPPPQPIPVPPVEASGGGLRVDSTVLLGIGAVILGAGAYFLLHKKHKNNGDGGGTTSTP